MPVKQTQMLSLFQKISGGYLTCKIKTVATDLAPDAAVLCAVKDLKTNNKINTMNDQNWISWGYEIPSDVKTSITKTLLSSDIDFHVQFLVKSDSPALTNEHISKIKFNVDYQINEKVTARITSLPIKPSFEWQTLDSAPIPANAIIGGSEASNSYPLYMCRLRANNHILPGKMLTHKQDGSKSVCYSTLDGATIGSTSDDGLTFLHSSDAFVLNSGVFSDSFTWQASNNGSIPTNAYATGLQANGEPLYSCRALENGASQDPNFPNNELNGEFVPGHISSTSGSCQYEFYGAKSKVDYEVLVWTGNIDNRSSVEYVHSDETCTSAVDNESPNQLVIQCTKP